MNIYDLITELQKMKAPELFYARVLDENGFEVDITYIEYLKSGDIVLREGEQ